MRMDLTSHMTGETFEEIRGRFQKKGVLGKIAYSIIYADYFLGNLFNNWVEERQKRAESMQNEFSRKYFREHVGGLKK